MLSSGNLEHNADGDTHSVRHTTDRAETDVFHLRPKYKSSAVVQAEIDATASAKRIRVDCAGIA